jgi:hypothetical protein
MHSALVEDWRDVPGYCGIYQASSRGRVRSLPRVVMQVNRWGKLAPHRVRGCVLKPWGCNSGYLVVYLSHEGEKVATSVHRIVCAAFNGDHGDDFEVNHVDGIKRNNAPSNLEWASHSENGLHRYDVLHVHRRVIATNKATGVQQEFESAKFGTKVITGREDQSARSNVRSALVGYIPSAYGHFWRYADSAAPQ